MMVLIVKPNVKDQFLKANISHSVYGNNTAAIHIIYTQSIPNLKSNQIIVLQYVKKFLSIVKKQEENIVSRCTLEINGIKWYMYITIHLMHTQL